LVPSTPLPRPPKSRIDIHSEVDIPLDAFQSAVTTDAATKRKNAA
jgi:hypothetical protein